MFRRKKRLGGAGILLVAACTSLPFCAFAQAGEVDLGELSVRTGVAFGGGSGGIGTQPVVGAGSGVALSRYAIGLFDFSYLPLGNHTIQGWPDRASVLSSHLMDFGVDFHIRVPVREKWAPYAIVGGGLLWNLVQQQMATSTRGYNQFNGALHTGGGVRYYVKENWGIRSEMRVIVTKQVYNSLSFGIFYIVPSNWP